MEVLTEFADYGPTIYASLGLSTSEQLLYQGGFNTLGFGSGLLARLATMYVGTIHAFCLHLLQNHASQYENYDILDENQHAALLSREYRRLKLDKLGPQHWLCSAKTFALGMKPR